ncbi:hypothetical protein Pelo_5825 [Pelomyxa schiedti]|nr:hypothetical protein Pelo_5825 [Pelomyxa schiedti]
MVEYERYSSDRTIFAPKALRPVCFQRTEVPSEVDEELWLIFSSNNQSMSMPFEMHDSDALSSCFPLFSSPTPDRDHDHSHTPPSLSSYSSSSCCCASSASCSSSLGVTCPACSPPRRSTNPTVKNNDFLASPEQQFHHSPTSPGPVYLSLSPSSASSPSPSTSPLSRNSLPAYGAPRIPCMMSPEIGLLSFSPPLPPRLFSY